MNKSVLSLVPLIMAIVACGSSGVATATVTESDEVKCSPPRFGTSVESGDDYRLIGESTHFKGVPVLYVLFECSELGGSPITFKWMRNGEQHCTRTNLSEECDQSYLMDLTPSIYESGPSTYYIRLLSKNVPDKPLDTGKYELIIYIDGKEQARGSFSIGD